MRRVTVLAAPAFNNKKDNPYNFILYTAIQKKNLIVKEYTTYNLINTKQYDILHLHWPENFIYGNTFISVFKNLILFLLKIAYVKIKGKKIVWTVHNLDPHEKRNLLIYKVAYRFLFRVVDGFISLTNFGAKEITKRQKIKPENIMVLQHPHYIGYYQNNISREVARKKLKIPSSHFVYLFIGQVRRYKNVISLVKVFKELNNRNATLVIAGKVHQDLADELLFETAGQSNIKLYPKFIDDEQLQLYINCADLIVNPFEKVFNSGSIFLNLSFNKPTLVPSTGVFDELQHIVGSAWIKTYKGDLKKEYLETFSKGNIDSATPDLGKFDWDYIAEETVTFYNRVLAKKKAITI